MDVYFRKIFCLTDDILYYYTDLTSNSYLGNHNGFSKKFLGFLRYP